MSLELPHNPDITYFAQTNYRGQSKIFGIQRKDRRQHMYVLGKSGMGKSTTLANMIIQDIKHGQGVCVVDPHGELVEDLLGIIPRDRLNDVVYFNPADVDYHIGFNVLEVDDERYKHLVASGIMGIFTKIWANVWSSRMEYILNNCILALIDTPETTLLGIQRLLVDKDYRQKIVNNIKDPVVRTFWVHEYEAWQDKFRNEAIAPIQNKVGQFMSSAIIRNILGQKKSTINIPKIMNSKKIFLVNLSKGRVGEDNSALLGAMLITKIQLAAMERVKIQEDARADFYLYVDEFQNFVTDSFATILSEARKYRLNLIIAHQYIAQLENEGNATVRDAVFGNVGTMIVGRVGAADAAFLETEFAPEFIPEDFVSLPNYHIYLKLLVNGMTTRPFSARTLPPIVKMEKNPRVEQYIIENSRKLYHRPRKDVEREIQKWSNSEEESERVEVNAEGLGTDGKYRVPCSFDDCDKIAVVPFKPDSNRPVYCRDCITKLKNGEKKPIQKNPQRNTQKAQASVAGLAALGLEFSSKEAAPPLNQTHNRDRRVSAPNQNNSNAKKPDRQSPKSHSSTQKQKHMPEEGGHARRNERSRPQKDTARQNRAGGIDRQKDKSRRSVQRKDHPKQSSRDESAGNIELGSLIQSALGQQAQKTATAENAIAHGKVTTDRAPQPKTISLKELAQRVHIEETIDLEERYKPTAPRKPKFDPSKQAQDEKRNALQAALAKVRPAEPATSPRPESPLKKKPSTNPEPRPEAVASAPPSASTRRSTEVPEGLLKHILDEDN